MAVSSSGLGRGPLTAETRVRFPVPLLIRILFYLIEQDFLLLHTASYSADSVRNSCKILERLYENVYLCFMNKSKISPTSPWNLLGQTLVPHKWQTSRKAIRLAIAAISCYTNRLLLPCFYLLMFTMFTSCKHQNHEAKYIRHFELDTSCPMDLSGFVDSIFITPLATNDSSLIKNVCRLSITDNHFYVNDNLVKVLSFDPKGTFSFSTEKARGNGPDEYDSCFDFNVQANGHIEIFDALKHKILEYDSECCMKRSSTLPDALFPAIHVCKASEDMYIFEDITSLKFYSLAHREIVNTVSLSIPEGLSKITKNAGIQRMNGNLYYSSPKPDHVLYSIDLATMNLVPHYLFDFGTKNFHATDLPQDQDLRFYQDYVMNRTDKAFVADKLVTTNWQLCFVIYNQKMHVALHDDRTGHSLVYHNQAGIKPQLMVPHLCQEDKLYYVCEPNHLDYVIDPHLMSDEDKEKLTKIHEDDNPILVCYKLK